MNQPNRTKIVATIGPASRGAEMLEKLLLAGVDVFRINAAHSEHKTMVQDIRTVRRLARRHRVHVGILVDLQGPKIRVGPLENAQPIYLERGERLLISCTPGVVGRKASDDEATRIGCGYEKLAQDVKAKERILLDDGMIELRVVAVEGTDVVTRVVYGGLLKQYKGINLPGSTVTARSLQPRDLDDLRIAVEQGADFIALSFVRKADEIAKLRDLIAKAGSDAQIIAKIERREAVKNLDEIVDAADGLMVARGDMGVELGPEVVPSLQKRIIRLALEARKPVITATQMLETMITNPRPTRAEVSDVANAIHDGTSAVMLSGETASGQYPLRAVQTMEKIGARTESDMFNDAAYMRRRRSERGSVTDSTVRAAAMAAYEVDARLIAVFTESGHTAQLLAAERPPTRIVAFSPDPRTLQRLALIWGVRAARVRAARTSNEMVRDGERTLLREKLAGAGDNIVVLVGSSRKRGHTNIMKIQTLG